MLGRILLNPVGQFSDDGRWWWDGTTWTATANVVLPQLPPTAFEQSGKVEIARSRLRKTGWLSWIDDAGCALTWLAAIPYSSVTVPALRDYRLWTLEQLAAATAYLLGPNEPMLAGEATIMPPSSGDSSIRDLAVAVTAAHVLLFRVDAFDGQPRWIVLAARPTDVNMEERSFLRSSFLGGLALTVSRGNAEWVIRGSPGVFEPRPVVEAWRQGSAQA